MIGLFWLWFVTLGSLLFLIMFAIEWMKGIEETQQMRKCWNPKTMDFDEGLSWWDVQLMLFSMEHAQRNKKAHLMRQHQMSKVR